MPLIELEKITFAYDPAEPPALRAFSLSVEAGECLVLTGDNGSGKTTLFRILNGLSFPQEGVYRFDGTEITKNLLKKNAAAKRFHQRIGYLFQNPELMLFNATVYDEIAFGPRQLGLSEAETDARVRDCMALFDLERLRGKAPYHLSGGQKKQVALAAVLALNPEVLILDEPMAGLDRKAGQRLLELLAELRGVGKTLLISSHDPELRSLLADRSIVLAAGAEDSGAYG